MQVREGETSYCTNLHSRFNGRCASVCASVCAYPRSLHTAASHGRFTRPLHTPASHGRFTRPHHTPASHDRITRPLHTTANRQASLKLDGARWCWLGPGRAAKSRARFSHTFPRNFLFLAAEPAKSPNGETSPRSRPISVTSTTSAYPLRAESDSQPHVRFTGRGFHKRALLRVFLRRHTLQSSNSHLLSPQAGAALAAAGAASGAARRG